MRRRQIAAVLIGAAVSLLAAGCASFGGRGAESNEVNTAGTSGDTEDGTAEGSADLSCSGDIRIWVPDQAVDLAVEQIGRFREQFPGLSDTVFTVEPMREDEAAARMLSDEEKGADLFVCAQDQVSRLVSAGRLEKAAPDYVDAVSSENDRGSVAAASVENTLYGYPLTSDGGYFLYYDSSVVKDPSDLEQILSDCGAAGKTFCMEINSGWYQTAFFFGTGCDLSYGTDEKGNFISADVDYASDPGITALKEMIRVASSETFQNTSSVSDAEKAGAIVDGTWDAEEAENLFGDHYACTRLPSFQGQDGESHQLSGFSGYRLLGVKPQGDSDRQTVCDALAFYLAGGDAQLERYQAFGWGPSNIEAQQSDDVKADAALTALLDQMTYDRAQGEYPGDYWTLAASLGDDVITGSLSEDSSEEDLMAALQSFQDACISYAE